MIWAVVHWLMSGLVLLVLGVGDATAETRLLRYPDIQDDTLVFCYGGDIYTASTNGENVIENIGISPDIEVANHPEQMIQGHDEQLERAISELMKQLNTVELVEGVK